MTNPLVLVVDADAKNLQILKENLEASGFVVITAANGYKGWEEIQRTPPNLVLTEITLPGLTGYQLLERLQADPNTKAIPLIFLTNQREIQQRVRGFELGAKDYLVKPLHVKEVIAHIRMVLRRLERRKVEQLETYMKFSGRLDQFNLADLIESFGVERKTGILTMSNGRRTGQVYFRDGAVINANLGDIKQEAAIYQMMPWNRGYFNMVFREVDVTDEISISNLGLLLHGIKRMELRNKLMGELSSPTTAFTITPNFKMLIDKRKVNSDIANFVKLLDGKRDVGQIIDESGLDDLVALKRIVRLYQQGFVKSTIPPEKKPLLHQRIEHVEEPIEFISKPKPKKLEPAREKLFDKKFAEEEPYEIKPIEKPKDLEKEIKPIFDRIEEETKKVLIPRKEEKPEEVFQAATDEDQELPEKVLDAETELTTTIELAEDELTTLSDEPFIDEELIQQPRIADEHDRIVPPMFEKEPEPIEPETVEQPEELEFETTEAEYKTEEMIRKEPPSITEKFIKTRLEKAEPAPLEPPRIKNNIMVVSVDDDCKDELMDILTNDNFTTQTIEQLDDLQINFGKIKFDGFSEFNILAISVDKPFNMFLESIKAKISGFIFAVDCSRRETWEYTAYLIHSMSHRFQAPYVIAIMNLHDQNSITTDVIRYQLNLDETIPLIAWDAVDKSVIRKLLTMVIDSNPDEHQLKTVGKPEPRMEKVML